MLKIKQSGATAGGLAEPIRALKENL